jgi:hypothetical protein
MAETDHLTQAQAQLTQARTNVLALLDSDAQLAELSQAAGDLGSILIAAADDDVMWRALSRSTGALDDQQRLQLRIAADIDWVKLLNKVGYRPPPPAEVYAVPFVDAIGRALERSKPDVDVVRDRVRELGRTLVRLSGQKDVAPSRLRGWLRKGARVAGKLAVAVGVAAAGATVGHILLGPLAAGAALVHLKHAKTAGEVMGEVVKDAAVNQLEPELDARLPDGDDEAEAEAERSADRKALERLYGISDAKLQRLADEWTQPPNARTDVVARVEECNQVLDATLYGLYIAWDAALGASWFTDGPAKQFEAIALQVQDVRNSLNATTPDAPATAAALRKLADILLAAKTQLPEEIRPLDPLDELRAEIDAQQMRVNELEEQFTDKQHVCTVLKQDLLRLQVPPRPRPGNQPPQGPALSPAELETKRKELFKQLEASEAVLSELRASLDQAKVKLGKQKERDTKFTGA